MAIFKVGKQEVQLAQLEGKRADIDLLNALIPYITCAKAEALDELIAQARAGSEIRD